jgi:hypothetical protein
VKTGVLALALVRVPAARAADVPTSPMVSTQS